MLSGLSDKCRRVNESISEMRNDNNQFQRTLQTPYSSRRASADDTDTSTVSRNSSCPGTPFTQSDDSVDNAKAIFKCIKCLQDVQGPRFNLSRHVARHEIARMECPIAGCGMRLTPTATYKHLVHVHDTSAKALDREEAKRHERELVTLATAMDQRISVYFPEGSYLGNVGTVKKTRFSNECSVCQNKVTSEVGRRDHIATHLKLKLKCPIEGCTQLLNLSKMSMHLQKRHSTKVSTLGQEEDLRFRQDEKAINDAIDKERVRFFAVVLE
uniref:C2H2-type domain-containing protein n=1 Tax=Steinernema glaseri TaxID=37863 RepID=A0A1I7XX18_9BILA